MINDSDLQVRIIIANAAMTSITSIMVPLSHQLPTPLPKFIAWEKRGAPSYFVRMLILQKGRK
jgi:hypothetical protein